MNPKPAKPEAPKPAPAAPPSLWRPDWRWHLRALGAVYAFLAVLYFVITAVLSRVPPPYTLRDIPPEVTPWLKK